MESALYRLCRIIIVMLLCPAAIHPQESTTITFNEVMFRPSASNSEFIEIFNLSDSDTLDLRGFRFRYHTSKPDSIISTNGSALLPPLHYAVIFENDYDIQTGIYSDITENVLVLKIEDNAFGSSGMSNSSDRTIYLINAQNDTIDTYTYTADNSAGISDEKVDYNSGTENLNWLNGKILNGTPGKINSVSRKDHDLSVIVVKENNEHIFEGDSLFVRAVIKNIGALDADNFSLTVFDDINFNSKGEISETIMYEEFTNLEPADSSVILILIESVENRDYHIILMVDFPVDQDTSNNLFAVSINVLPQPRDFGDVVINEIMYKPQGDEPEWIELFNNTRDSVNLKNWQIEDRTKRSLITDEQIYIQPDGYMVVAEDESILDFHDITSPVIEAELPSLNNSGDKLILADSLGTKIDSVEYLSSWGGHSGGISLERINPAQIGNDSTNWSGSISATGATPGARNSVVPHEYDLIISSIIINEGYAIVGDGIELTITIKNEGVKLIESYSLYIFNDTNLDSLKDISELEHNISGASISPGDSIKHQFSLANYNEGPNYYIAAISSVPEDYQLNNDSHFRITGIRLNEVRNDIIINEIMYSPVSPEPEWIELYNNSDKTVDLNGYMVSDKSDTSQAINENYYLSPDSYAVVASDSIMLEMYPGISNMLIHNLPLLNNSGDRLMLIDSLGRIIDSLWFYSNWGGGRGISLERIIPAENSADSSNWASSLSSGTPGFINSVTPRDYDLALCSLIVFPENPILKDEISLQAIIKNKGLISAENFTVKYFVEDLSEYVIDEITYDLLETEDSAVISFYRSFSLSGTAAIIASIDFEQDENLDNNTDTTKVIPGYPQSTIIITEFMSRPIAGNSEWIELYNSTRNAINIKGWTVSDVSPRIVNKRILEYDHYVNPLSYFILAQDTSNSGFDINGKLFEVPFGSLGNSEDGIIITDMNGNLIDSIYYTRNWQISKGQSLERRNYMVTGIDSSNWLTSLAVSGGTPGVDNSVSSLNSYAFNQVVINEIMFAPKDEGTEFIELMNISNDAVDLGGWIFGESGGNSFRISNKMVLPQGSYFIFAADSSILHTYYNTTQLEHISILNKPDLGLSNSGESIVISDALGNVMDSLTYSDSWHNRNITIVKNRSLERINPFIAAGNGNNWSSSAADEGATPGRENSIFTQRASSAGSMNISPNPFSPDNDGFEDFTIISYKLKTAPAQIRVKIYDDHGRLIRTLANNVASGLSGDILFDGLNDSGKPLRIGMYIVFLEAIEPLSGEVETMKKIIVVARPL